MNFNLDFRVLAYPASNLLADKPVSPSPCSLVFRCDDAKLATLLLVVRIPTAHNTESQFVLQYDADKLMPYAVKLSSGNGHMTQQQLDEILPTKGKGKKRPDVKTLDLSTSCPCPLWCSFSDSSFSPEPGHELAFQALISLAKATRIHIVLDYGHVRRQHQGMFKAFCKAARGLTGYPVEVLLAEQGLKTASWEVFAPTEAIGAPPAYDGSCSRKRPRQGSLSSSTQPPRSWTPKSPTGSHSSDGTIPFSPVTATAALRRAELDYQTGVITAAFEKRLKAHFDTFGALQMEAINASITKHLPLYLTANRLAEAIEVSVSRQLDTTLQTLLPNVMEDLLIPRDMPASPATSFTSFDSRGNKYPKLPPLTRIGRAMLPHLRTHLTEQFHCYQKHQLQRFQILADKTFDDLERAAYNDRAREHADFETEMEEHKTEISLLKKDTLDDLWRQGDTMLEQGKEICAAFGEEINDQLFGLCDKIDRLNKHALKRMVAAEVSKQRKRKKGIPRRWGRNMLRGEHRLLGKRREEDVWEDV